MFGPSGRYKEEQPAGDASAIISIDKVTPITKARGAHAAERSQRDREVVRRTAELLAADVPLSTIFSQFCALLARFVDVSRAFIALCEAETLRIVYLLDEGAVGEPSDAEIRAGTQSALVAKTGTSILKRAASDWHDRITIGIAGRGTKPGVVSAVFVPLKFGNETIGVLSVQTAVEGAYDEGDVEMLETCALYLAVRVHHAGEATAKRAFKDLAAIDGLTGIANRRCFDERLGTEWVRCAKFREPLALLFSDVDFFKSFNDGYGHVAGDASLQQIAGGLADCVARPTDLLARYGGEEFVAILPGTDAAGAIAVAESMRSAVAKLGIAHQRSSLGHVSLSVGAAAMVPSVDIDPIALVQRADEALYEAKAAGRNRVVGPYYQSDAPPAQRQEETRHNIPLQLTPFLGRERELGDVRAALGDARLVTLAGAGGIGKTRLALEVARGLLDAFADGVWLIELASVADPSLVAGTIAAVLRLPTTPNASTLDMLAAFLKSKVALLVFDNCEHLTEPCAQIVDALLRQAPQLEVLATSREPLGIAGELTYRVASLALPAPDQRIVAEQALHYDGVRFFATRAANVGFTLTDANAATVAHICRRLDGIPLALELAVARLKAMSVEQLAKLLDDRFRTLTGGSRAALPRQQTLRALIDWSYNLLNAGERAVFERLSVFAASWSMEAAAAVCSEELEPWEVTDLLTQLVEKSLVLAETSGPEIRYRFMESTREYARDRLIVSGDAASLRTRHVAYFRGLAEYTIGACATSPTRTWLPPLIAEADNFRSVLEWTLGEHQDPDSGAAVALGLVPYWETVSRPGEALAWLERAFAEPSLSSARKVELCLGIGYVLRIKGDSPERVIALGEQALVLAGDAASERVRAFAFLTIGGGYLMQLRLAEAHLILQEALALARACGDRLIEADTLNSQGAVALYGEERAAAETAYGQAIAIAREIGHDRKLARSLHNLSEIMYDRGDGERALTYQREAVAILERHGTPYAFLVDLGLVELMRGNVETAYDICGEMLDGLIVQRETSNVRECLSVLANVQARRGRLERAVRVIGYMSSLDDNLGPRQPQDARRMSELVASLRAALPELAYAQAFHEGEAMTLEAASIEAKLPL